MPSLPTLIFPKVAFSDRTQGRAVWKSRWPHGLPDPNSPNGLGGRKAILNRRVSGVLALESQNTVEAGRIGYYDIYALAFRPHRDFSGVMFPPFKLI